MNRALLARASVMTLALIAAAAFARAADEEMVENPAYKSWAKFKAGTSITYRQETDSGGQKNSNEITMTLLEISPEKAVLEAKSNMTGPDGKKMDLPAQKMPIEAKIPKSQAPPEPGKDAKEDPAKPKMVEGKEEIEVAGKKYQCKTMENIFKTGEMTSVSKAWLDESVPGGMVRTEVKTSGGGVNMTGNMTVISVTIK